MMKKFLILCFAFLITVSSTFAMEMGAATLAYRDELVSLGMDSSDALEKAKDEVDAVLDSMESDQNDIADAYEALDTRVDQIDHNDGRYDEVNSALDKAKDAKNSFTGISPDQHIDVQPALAGALPRVLPDAEFELAQERASDALATVNRILIAPSRPGNVPEGDIVSDFLPQLIRQLFRFAWLAILIALTASGIFMIVSHDNEEMISKAKNMIVYSLIGFGAIAFAFAIVKALTDIDFFRFI